jgi:DNA-binding protein YbaB
MEQPNYHLPNDRVLQDLMGELNKALDDMPNTQERLLSLSGTAWSDDGMVKAVVGPRGQLVDLEIDPRVFRRPDSASLRDSILGAVTAAIRQVAEQTNEIVFGQIPPEVEELRAQFSPTGDDNPLAQMLRTDAELMADRRRSDDDLR